MMTYSYPEKFCPILALENVVQNFSGELYCGRDENRSFPPAF